MDVTCQTDREMPAAVRDEMQRMARGRFERFGRRVRRVSGKVLDINGPRGGVDIRCRLAVTLAKGGEVIIEETAPSIREALSGAFHRAAHTVARKLDRAGRTRRPALAADV